jgi:hypothetical protein
MLRCRYSMRPALNFGFFGTATWYFVHHHAGVYAYIVKKFLVDTVVAGACSY